MPNADVRLQLRQAVIAMSGFASVTLLDTDLTQSNELIVERLHQRTKFGELIQGRDLEMPRRFQLLLEEGQCVLLNTADGQRKVLQDARCSLLDSH